MVKRPPNEEGSAPKSFPAVTPEYGQSVGSSHQIEMMMELQKTLSSLDTKVDRLIADVKDLGGRVRGLEKLWHMVLGGSFVVGAVISIGLTLAKFIQAPMPTIQTVTVTATTAPPENETPRHRGP